MLFPGLLDKSLDCSKTLGYGGQCVYVNREECAFFAITKYTSSLIIEFPTNCIAHNPIVVVTQAGSLISDVHLCPVVI